MLPSSELRRIAEPAGPDEAASLIDAVEAMPVCIDRDGMPLAVMLTAAQFDELNRTAAALGLPKA